MAQPQWIGRLPNIKDQPDYAWPPSIGVCPKCAGPTGVISESYGRYWYYCYDTACPHFKVEERLWYARLPYLWDRCRYAVEMQRLFPDILTNIVFLVGDFELTPCLFQCDRCRHHGSGLWHPQATSGFAWVPQGTTEERGDNRWEVHRIICDDCLRKNVLLAA